MTGDSSLLARKHGLKLVLIQGLVGISLTLVLLLATPESLVPIALALMVGLVGMPHGGVDHRSGQVLLSSRFGSYWPIIFLLGYGLVMVVVLVGWLMAPLMTLTGFVLLSSVHFGLADSQPRSVGQFALSIVQGGMVVWLPALVRPAEFTQLLSWVVPDQNWPVELLFDPRLRYTLMLALVIVGAGTVVDRSFHSIIAISMIILFVSLPPLLSFAVYFCGWHSVIELTRMSRQANPKNQLKGLKTVIKVSAPLALLAVMLANIGWLLIQGHQEFTAGLIQTLFISLSIVAVPHMLLHLVTDYYQINPFTNETQS